MRTGIEDLSGVFGIEPVAGGLSKFDFIITRDSKKRVFGRNDGGRALAATLQFPAFRKQ
jgi:hypothetical protein